METLKSIHIVKFRDIENLEFNFGKKLTLIAGQNGTMKSSILGLIGGPFDFEKKVKKIEGKSYRTINDKPFNKNLKEAFLWAYPEYEKAGDHEYSIFISENSDPAKELYVKSFLRSDTDSLRFVVGKSRMPGEGHYIYPVIHLSLSRLFPLSEGGNISKHSDKTLSQDEIKKYTEWHNNILILNEQITPEYIESPLVKKTFLGGKAPKYDTRGFSAGQDNIGQIITSVLSFGRLKNELAQDYKGGILLIDELETTLFPAAQKKLVEYLYKFAREYSIQIIATTHSKEILQFASQEKYKFDTEIVFLSKARGSIEKLNSNSINLMINDMDVTANPPNTNNSIPKIDILCEDDEAKLFIKQLLPQKYYKRLNLSSGYKGLGGDFLISIARSKLPSLKDVIFIVDGDKKSEAARLKKSHVLSLPGNKSPENMFFEFLFDLPGDHEFWGGIGSYTKQVCFKDYPSGPPSNNDRAKYKSWFNEQMPFWGKNGENFFRLWNASHSDICNKFSNDFKNMFNSISKYPLD